MIDTIQFTVLGKAQTAGSKKGFPVKGKGEKLHVSIVDANTKTKPWQAVVAYNASQVYDGPLITGPIRLTIWFVIERPKGHYGTGRNAGKLKPSAPVLHSQTPDVLKLTRAIEDALTGVIWKDDAQICDEALWKRWGERHKMTVMIEQVTADTREES